MADGGGEVIFCVTLWLDLLSLKLVDVLSLVDTLWLMLRFSDVLVEAFWLTFVLTTRLSLMFVFTLVEVLSLVDTLVLRFVDALVDVDVLSL
jgi:hypothetical protein